MLGEAQGKGVFRRKCTSFPKTLNIPRKYSTTTNLQREGRPPKLTDQARRALIREAIKRPKITLKLQTVSGNNISTRTVRRELHEMGFHGRADAHKPKITMRNANDKRRLEWCNFRRHWTLEWKHVLWSDELPNPPTSVPDLTYARG
uniref:Transposase Tc1-like domain-containing protein n=1 Tax=Oncorhynchus mykiss TaxID=8022 RepID=A0A8K9XJ18_ONCMY